MASYTDFKNAMAERLTADDIEAEAEETGAEVSNSRSKQLLSANRQYVDYLFKDLAPQVIVELLEKDADEGKNPSVPTGVATFRIAHSEPRKGRNPRTGEEIDIPEKWRPKVAAPKALKDEIDEIMSKIQK